MCVWGEINPCIVVGTASLRWNKEASIGGQKLVDWSLWVFRLTWDVLLFNGVPQDNNNPSCCIQSFFPTRAFPRGCL